MATKKRSKAGKTGKKREKKEKDFDFLKPLRGKIKHRDVMVYDFESKDGESQCKGFTRSIMNGFLDQNDVYRSFWNENPPDPNFRRRALDKGGIVDSFLRLLFGFSKDCPIKAKYCHPILAWTHRFAELWAHNGGRFDATPLLVWLRRYQDVFDTQVTFIAGCAQRITVRLRGARRGYGWVFLDSSMLLKMKLSQATELFSAGRKKLANFDLDTDESDRKTWELYNADDCRGLRDALFGFRDMIEDEGGEMGTTAPSTSMKLWRRSHLSKAIPRASHFPGCDGICHGCIRNVHCDKKCHGCLHEWLRIGLVGGRTEILERYAPAPVYYLDRNSSYPASSLELMPVGLPYIQSGAEFFATHAGMRASGKIGFIQARVHIPSECKLPPLPKVCDGKLKFPAGDFSGLWEYDELMLLNDPLVNGTIVDVTMAVWFTGEKIFNSFMTSLYEYRLKKPKEKDPSKMTPEERACWARSEFAKLEMNVLVGKTATNPEREEMIMISPRDPWPSGARPITGKQGNCGIWLRPKWIDADYIIPQLNMRVLALGRIAWWQAAASILRRGGRVYAGDTDAVQASIELEPEFIHHNELGKWKREYEDDEYEAEFVQLKNYAMNSVLGGTSIVHMKGIPRKHQDMRTFMRFRNGEELRWAEDRISQPKHVLKELERGGEVEGISMLDSVKRFRSQYDKRIVHDDGTTSPIVLNEPREAMQ